MLHHALERDNGKHLRGHCPFTLACCRYHHTVSHTHTHTPLSLCWQILGESPTPDDIKSGRVTPMFFGSAFNNFGVDLFLQVGGGFSVVLRVLIQWVPINPGLKQTREVCCLQLYATNKSGSLVQYPKS